MQVRIALLSMFVYVAKKCLMSCSPKVLGDKNDNIERQGWKNNGGGSIYATCGAAACLQARFSISLAIL